jgi:hypothetical protein
MLIVLGVLIVASALAGAALALTANNANLVSRTVGGQKAQDAAQAGVNVVLAQLNQNSSGWLTCPSQSSPQLVDFDQPDNATELPYRDSYTYSTLPANTSYSGTTYTKCEANNADSIIDATPGSAGDLRVLFTGYAGPTSATTGKQIYTRSLVASYSPVSFTRFLSYTNYEVLDPSILWPTESSKATGCTRYYSESRTQVSATAANPGTSCLALRLVNPGDNVAGPLWSNDSLDLCESPSLGLAGSSNVVEAAGTYCDTGASASKALVDGTSGTPTATGGTKLTPPATLSSIATEVAAHPGWACTFTGPTDIVLNGNNIEASNAKYYTLYKPAKSYSYNYCRVIYVYANSGASCTDTFTPFGAPYDDPLNSESTVGKEYVGGNNGSEQLTTGANGGCGDAYVSGSYSRSVTIAAAGDVVINGSITNTSANKTAVLGLAATNWVRVFHPVESGKYNSACTGNSNKTAADLKEPTIEAAILADQHSFIVDNYNCGATLGKLNVVGSIAQNYRGPVAAPLNSGTITSGYEKNYTYNPILASDDPPYFPTPEGADWIVARQTLCFGTTGNSSSSLCGNPTE